MNTRQRAFEDSRIVQQSNERESDGLARELYRPPTVTPMAMTSLPVATTHSNQLQRLSAPNARLAVGQLQRAYGNRYLGQISQQASQGQGPLVVQPKLTVTPPNDRYEQEADRVADQVVLQIESGNQSGQQGGAVTANSTAGNQSIRALAPSAPLMLERVNAAADIAGVAVSADTESTIERARGTGQPLPTDTRTLMERHVGKDFSKVRVHTDAQADLLNQEFGSKALTFGQDIYFKSGEYSPKSREGQSLLAHELTHVVQQFEARPPSGPSDTPTSAKSSNGQVVQMKRSNQKYKEPAKRGGRYNKPNFGTRRPAPRELPAEEQIRRRTETQDVSSVIGDEPRSEENIRRLAATSENYRNLTPSKPKAEVQAENSQGERETGLITPKNEPKPIEPIEPIELAEAAQNSPSLPETNPSAKKKQPPTFEGDFPNAPSSFTDYCREKKINLNAAITNGYGPLAAIIKGYAMRITRDYFDANKTYPDKMLAAKGAIERDIRTNKAGCNTMLKELEKLVSCLDQQPGDQQTKQASANQVKPKNQSQVKPKPNNPPLKNNGQQTAQPISYEKIGVYHDKTVYGSINWDVIEQHHTQTIQKFRSANFDYKKVYGDAMVAELCSSGDIGTSCTKPEGDKKWVVKLSWKEANSHGITDLNLYSPCATETRDDKAKTIHLIFDNLINRHPRSKKQ